MKTAFVELVCAMARRYSSHQRHFPAGEFIDDSGEYRSGGEMLALFREYWGDEAVDKAIEYVNKKYYPRSKFRALSQTESDKPGSLTERP